MRGQLTYYFLVVSLEECKQQVGHRSANYLLPYPGNRVKCCPPLYHFLTVPGGVYGLRACYTEVRHG